MKNYLNEITEMQSQITEIRKERYLLQESTNQKVKEVLDYYFNFFEGMEIKVSNSSATFHSKDEDGFNKEILSLYFDDRYGNPADQLRISYYSTSTNSEFEIDRLIRLGNTARVIKNSSEAILNEIKKVSQIDSERSNELFSIELKYEKQITEYRNQEAVNRKVQIELDLRSEGITFSGRKYITLKRNYDPQVEYIKIVEVSKSGKTCTVEYSTGYSTSKEENCNMQKVIDQVTYLHKDIVSTQELV